MAGSTVRFESRTVIQRPISEVFELLADLPGYGGWMHRTGLFRGCRLTSEIPIRKGTTYVDSTRMGAFDGEVTEFARAHTNRLSGDPALVRQPDDTGPARILPGRKRDRNGRSPRGRRGALWLDEVHEARRSMDGEPGAEPHPELPEAFPDLRLRRDVTGAGRLAPGGRGHPTPPDRDAGPVIG